MTEIVRVRLNSVSDDEVDRKSTRLRKAAEVAVGRALEDAGYRYHVPEELHAGIIGFTKYGERYPELWLSKERRVHPLQFGSGILNSVIGHCSIVYHLTGPQILLTKGSMFEVADLQLTMCRSRLMVLCRYDDPLVVEVEVVQR